jgi:hypothetical protein
MMIFIPIGGSGNVITSPANAREEDVPSNKFPLCPTELKNGRSLGSLSQALQDPAFFEYFVVNAKAILTSTICPKKKLCNGTQGTYHSLILSDTMETYLKLGLRRW